MSRWQHHRLLLIYLIDSIKCVISLATCILSASAAWSRHASADAAPGSASVLASYADVLEATKACEQAASCSISHCMLAFKSYNHPVEAQHMLCRPWQACVNPQLVLWILRLLRPLKIAALPGWSNSLAQGESFTFRPYSPCQQAEQQI